MTVLRRCLAPLFPALAPVAPASQRRLSPQTAFVCALLLLTTSGAGTARAASRGSLLRDLPAAYVTSYARASTAGHVFAPGPRRLPAVDHRIFSPVSTLLAQLIVTKTDALIVDADADGKADPGDTVRYTVIVENQGDEDALDVTFDDVLDPNTTLVAGSQNASPVAFDQTVAAASGTGTEILLSAADADADALTFSMVEGPTQGTLGAITPVSSTTARVTYTPGASPSATTDTFTFQVNDGSVDANENGVVTLTLDEPPAVTATTPADAATDVSPASDITITFSEPVDVAAAGVTVACPVGTPVAITGLPATGTSSLTLTPSSGLPGGVTCTVTVDKDLVTDADGNDPPDGMASDYVFSFSLPPVAQDDAYTASGNITAAVSAPGVLDNDEGSVLTVSEVQGDAANVGATVATAATGLNGASGWVTLNADGSFTYEPPPGYTGDDSFTYRAANAGGTSDVATVTVTIGAGVWFIDNSAPSSANLGTFSQPFRSIGAFNAAQDDIAPAASAKASSMAIPVMVFLHTGTGTYADGIMLRDGQHLIGQAVALTDVFTPAPATSSQFATAVQAGTAPVIAPANGDGVTLAFGNDVRGLDVGDTPNGYGFADGGATVGPLTIQTASVTGLGGALKLANGGNVDNVAFDALNATNAAEYGVYLAGVEGTMTVTEASTGLASAAVNALYVSGGSVSLTYPGAIAHGAVTPAVVIDGGHTGTVSHTGTLTTTGGGIRLADADGIVSFADVDAGTAASRTPGDGIVVESNSDGTFTFSDARLYTSGRGIVTRSGTLTVTAGAIDAWNGAALDVSGTTFNGSFSDVTVQNTAGAGVLLTNNTGTVTLNRLSGTTTDGAGFAANNAGTVNILAGTIQTTNRTALRLSQTNVGAGGIHLSRVSSTGTGDYSGLLLDNVGGAGALTIDDGNAGVASDLKATLATTTTAASIASTSIPVTIAGVDVANAGGSGIALTNNTGVVTITDGTIANVAGTAFDVSGGTANITYGGTIANTSGRSVRVTGRTGGTLDFNDAITDQGEGVLLQSNTGATITFAGDLTLSTGAFEAFKAVGGGIVNVTGANNTVATGTGTAVRIDGTTIGGSGVAWKSVTANGAPNGIVLANTGTTGTFTVTGDGSLTRNASGGTIQNTTGDAVSLANASGVTLRSMDLLGSLSDGVAVLSGRDLVLSAVTIADQAALALRATNLGGAANRIDYGSLVKQQPSSANSVAAIDLFYDQANTGTLTIDGGTYTPANGAVTNGTAFLTFRGFGSSTATLRVRNGAVFEGLYGSAIVAAAGNAFGDQAALTVDIDDATFRNAAPNGFNTVEMTAAQNGTGTLNLSNSRLTNVGLPLANAGAVTVQGTSSGTINATLTGNTISQIGGRRGIHVTTNSNSSNSHIRIEGNTFESIQQKEAVYVSFRDYGTNHNLRIDNNTIGTSTNRHSGSDREAIEVLAENNTRAFIEVTNNTLFTNTFDQSLDVDVEDLATMDLHVTNNSVDAAGFGEAIDVESDPVGSTMCLAFSGNTGATAYLDQAAGTMFKVEGLSSLAASNSFTTINTIGTLTDVAAGTCQAPTFPALSVMLGDGDAPASLETPATTPPQTLRRPAAAAPSIAAVRTHGPAPIDVSPVEPSLRVLPAARDAAAAVAGLSPSVTARAVASERTADAPKTNAVTGTGLSVLPTSSLLATVDVPVAAEEAVKPPAPLSMPESTSAHAGEVREPRFAADVADTADAATPVVAASVSEPTLLASAEREPAVTAAPSATPLPTMDALQAAFPASNPPSDVSYALGTLPASKSVTITFDVTVDATLAAGADAVCNQSWAGSPGVDSGTPVFSDDPDNAAGSDDPTCTLVDAAPDLTLAKSDGDAAVRTGEAITFTLSYDNVGTQDAVGVTITETVPTGTTSGTNAGWEIAPQGSGLACDGQPAGTDCVFTVGDLAVGAGASTDFVVVADNPLGAGIESIENTASISDDGANGDDLNPSDNTAVDTTPVAAAPRVVATKTDVLLVDLDHDGRADPGDVIGYTVLVTNDGDQAVSEVVFTDTVDPNTVLDCGTHAPQSSQGSVRSCTAGPGGTLTVDLGTIAGEARKQAATVTFQVTVQDPFLQTAAAVTNQGRLEDAGGVLGEIVTDDPDTPAIGDATITPVDLAADLAVDLTANTTAPDYGGNVVYHLTVTNLGPGIADVSVSDALPSGLAFVSATPAEAYDAESGLWTVGSVAPSASATLTVTARVETTQPVTYDAGFAASSLPDPDPSNDGASVTITPVAADLSLAQDLAAYSEAGGIVTAAFRLTLTNDGPSAASSVEVVSLLPGGLTLVSAEAGQGHFDAGTGLWHVGSLNAGDAAVLTLTVTGSSAESYVHLAEVTAAAEPDPDSTPGDLQGDDFSGLPLGRGPVDPSTFRADLALAMEASTEAPEAGEAVTFTLTLANGGPFATAGVAVAVQWPEALSFEQAATTAPDDTFDPATGLWRLGQVRDGEERRLTLTGRVEAMGPFTVSAEVTSSHLPDPDSETGNGRAGEDDLAVVTIEAGADSADDSGSEAVGTEEDGGVPQTLALYGNYPNPFNPETMIPFGVPEAGRVRLAIYNLLGREVATLVDGRLAAGRHQVTWRADGLPTGVYVVRLSSETAVRVRRITLMK